nr:3-hydroxyisobutyryl-coa hydrolase, mitochondrial [Quercus suber]
MCRKIIPRLQEWSKSDMANVIVLKGEGRALCAGGDVAALALDNKKGAAGQQASKDYFALEYKLDHMIATYPKPYVAFMDGITMGGGVGLSLHAPFRIATENTVFAMPETTIGFFPDVGASFFLPRLDGELGMYLALTSEQVKGVNALYAGVATHYLHSSSLSDLEARLGELQFKDYDDLATRVNIINSTIDEFSTGVPHDQHPTNSNVGGDIRAAVDYVFQPANDIDGILNALKGIADNEGGTATPEVREWCTKTRNTILSRSPTSVKVTLRQLREAKHWSIAQTFRREHTIASRFMEHPDFVEGVSAQLIDKPRRAPHWSPKTLAEVSPASVDAFYAPTDSLELLASGAQADYRDYPFRNIGLLRDSHVRTVVNENPDASQDAIVEKLVLAHKGRQGVRQKVEEVLLRKTDARGSGLAWKR